MAIPTAAQVRTISLSSVFDAPDITDAQIDEAVRQVAQMYLSITSEPEHTDILALHACHILVITGLVPDVGPSGPVASATAGSVSASFAVTAKATGTGLDDSTPWGARAMDMLRRLPPTPRSGGWSPWV